MKKSCFVIIAASACSAALLAGDASGTYEESGGRFTIGYAVAERDPDSGAVRILLVKGRPADQPDREHHLKRLEAIGEAAEGGYMIIEPTPDGEGFNISISLDEIGGGGGGQYASRIDLGEERVVGSIDAEVLSGRLKVTFDAEYLSPRRVVGDLAADGGKAGKALLDQMTAVASGDRDRILATLSEEHRQAFAEMSAEEQEEALSSTAEFAPRNVQIKGGEMYEGYAIVHFDAEQFGEKVAGKALLSQKGDRWLVREVSMEVN